MKRYAVPGALLLIGLASFYFVFLWNQGPRHDDVAQVNGLRAQLVLLRATLKSIEGRPLTTGDKLFWERLEEQVRVINAALSSYQMFEAEGATRRHYEDATWWADKVLRLILVISVLVAALSGLGFYSLTTMDQKTTKLQTDASSIIKRAEDSVAQALQLQEQTRAMRENVARLQERADLIIQRTEQAVARVEKTSRALVAEFEQLDIDSILREGLFLVEPLERREEFEYYDIQVTAWEVHADIPAHVYLALGKYFFARSESGKALIRFNHALERNPRLAEAHFFRAFCVAFQARRLSGNAKRERLHDARQEFEAALRLDDCEPNFYVGMGWWEDEVGNYAEAIRWYEKALERDRRFVIARYNIACAHSKAGEAEKARDHLQQIELKPHVRRWIEKDMTRDLAAVKATYPGFLEGLISPGQTQ